MVETKSIATLANLAQQLNTQSENLNESISALNEQLAALNLGLEVWLDGDPIEDSGWYISSPPWADFGENKETCVLTTLGYCKVEDKWQMAIKDETLYGKEDTTQGRCVIVPLVKASRARRMKAARLFDELISAMNGEAKEMLTNVRKAAKLATID